MDKVRHDGTALLQRRFGAEVAVEAQEVEFEAVQVVVLDELAEHRELLCPHFRLRPVQNEVGASQRAGFDAVLGMLGIPACDAHADAAARFVAGLGIDELFVMRVVHAQRDEGCLTFGTTALDEALHDVAAVEHELAKRIRLLPVALFDPREVLLQIDPTAWPHRYHTKTRLQKVRIH